MAMLVTTLVLVGGYLAVWIAERIPAMRFRPGPWLRRYTATDLAWLAVALTAAAVTALLLQPLLKHARLGLLAPAFESIPGGPQLLIAVAVYDLVAFGMHVAIHRSDRLWKIHKVHHSSLELDGLATTRTHTMELFVRNVPAQLALFAIGASAQLVGMTVLIYALFALLGHSNLDLPANRLEALFITPRLHRLHHIPDATLRNYGTIFSLWDRAYGSLVRRDASPHERTGVPGEMLTHPQRFIPSLRAPFRDEKRPRWQPLR
jgi:sterol desaturase/sphingolipid hydroxylase (fatty acid hydroxylase superfamily)